MVCLLGMCEPLDHNSRKEGRTMKKITVITLAGAIAMMLAFGIGIARTAGPCIVGQGYDQAPATRSRPPQNGFPSFRDGWNIERGMMGPGMMGISPWKRPPFRQFSKPLDKEDAQALSQSYLDSTNNPNLKLGRETDKGTRYEFDVVTRDDSLVDRLLVSKDTGEIRSAY
jgi:hypothetical protein